MLYLMRSETLSDKGLRIDRMNATCSCIYSLSFLSFSFSSSIFYFIHSDCDDDDYHEDDSSCFEPIKICPYSDITQLPALLLDQQFSDGFIFPGIEIVQLVNC
jgi:hypothetical protein